MITTYCLHVDNSIMQKRQSVLLGLFGTLYGLNTNNTGKFSADSLHSVISQNSSKEDDPVTILYYSNCNIKEHTGEKHMYEWVFTVNWRRCGHSLSTHTSCPVTITLKRSWPQIIIRPPGPSSTLNEAAWARTPHAPIHSPTAIVLSKKFGSASNRNWTSITIGIIFLYTLTPTLINPLTAEFLWWQFAHFYLTWFCWLPVLQDFRL